MGIPKKAEFYAYSKSEDEIEKKYTNKSYFKKLAKKQFFENNFFVMHFFQFCLRNWNQCKTLRLLVPILTYLKKKVFSSIFEQF